MQIGYKLASEAFDPQELVRQAVLAEQSGFDFVEMSDHYHPWLDVQGHSSFTWSVLPVIAADLGDGLFAVEPGGDLVSTWQRLGGSGPAYAEIPLAWAPDEDTAAQAVLEKNRFALAGWKVMAELPNPVNFAAATATVTAEQVKAQFACGPDVSRHLQVAQEFVNAGFDHLVTLHAGPDPDGFMDFFASQLAKPLRALTPL
jgi:G6PDH family F420-dependent oxidoreductase